EAYALLMETRKLVRYLESCDGNMEEGSLRCDANVSVMLNGATAFGKKVEVKNMNSMRNVQRAIDHEVERQTALPEGAEEVVADSRLIDASTGPTVGMRTKVELNDYRYFPDPDLSPVEISDAWLKEIQQEMPAIPRELFRELVEKYELPAYDAQVLTDSKDVVLYFKAVCGISNNFKVVSNWVMGTVKNSLRAMGVTTDELQIGPELIGSLITLVEEGKLSFTVASRTIFPELLKNPGATALEVAKALNVIQE